jgi:hypothetical protein
VETGQSIQGWELVRVQIKEERAVFEKEGLQLKLNMKVSEEGTAPSTDLPGQKTMLQAPDRFLVSEATAARVMATSSLSDAAKAPLFPADAQGSNKDIMRSVQDQKPKVAGPPDDPGDP